MHGAAEIRPFHYQNLPKIRKSEIYFFDTLARIFPTHLFQQALIPEISQALEPYIQGQLGYQWIDKEQYLDFSQIERLCLPPTLLIEIALLPADSRFLLELDPRLAAIMIDRALGGTGEGLETGRALNEVERGVFTFLLLKVLQHVQQTWQPAASMELRLAGLHQDPTPLRQHIPPDALYHRKELYLGLLQNQGFARLYTPIRLIQELASSLSPQDSAQEMMMLQSNFHLIADQPLTGHLRVGTVMLSEADLAGLEAEDIVLLRECSASPTEEGILQGEAMLHFGQRSAYALRCRIDEDPSSNRRVIIEQLIRTDAPGIPGILDRSEYEDDNQPSAQSEYQEGDMPGGYGDDANYEEMAPVLSDVPVPLIVELGRVEAKARDLAYLRLGQVLELRRSPYEPLDLVVNGQILGKGELVEIDGQLGVRIIELRK
ncbi:MAG: type III secretion system cytoplasmic ring protein SctQ [Myxococcales bacterium]|nr:type III secretion system cytoplasmic ring protein SctQ [Myxococcales bacterium]MCB9644540.1 type III secretion system cytoplasmic ring protein SctQ [Myxococcales bacterium]